MNVLTRFVAKGLCRGCNSRACLTTLTRRGLRGRISIAPTAPVVTTVKDQPTPTIASTISNEETDVLSAALIKSDTLSKLLEIVGINRSSISKTHVFTALSKLSHLKRQSKSNFDVKIYETLLKTLCGRLLSISRLLEPRELLDVVKYFIALDVSTRSVIFQTILQHIRMDVNDFRLKELVFLYFLLEKVPRETSTNLVAALKDAIPLVIRNNLRFQINDEDQSELLQLLEFGAKHRFYWKYMVHVIIALESHCPLSLESSMSVLWSFSVLSEESEEDRLSASTTYQLPVLQSAIKVVCKDIHHVDVNALRSLICRLAKRGLYVEPLFSAFARHISGSFSSWELESVIHVMSAFALVHHVDIALLDEYCFLMSEKDDRLIETITAGRIVAPFAVANYKPPLIQSVLERWSRNQLPLKWDANVDDNFRLLVQLEILGYDMLTYELPSQVEDIGSLLDFVRHRNSNTTDLRSVLRDGLLLLQLKRFRCDKASQMPVDDEKTFVAVAEILRETELAEGSPHSDLDRQLSAALKQALGDNYIVCDDLLSTRTGIQLNYLIVPRSYGVAVASLMNDCRGTVPFLLDDQQSNDKNATVVVLVRNSSDYAVNCQRLLGNAALEGKVLETLGHRVVQISMDNWNCMPERERLPYLRFIIEEALTNITHQI